MAANLELSKFDVQNICEQYLKQAKLNCATKNKMKDFQKTQILPDFKKQLNQIGHIADGLKNNNDHQNQYQSPKKDNDNLNDEINTNLITSNTIQNSIKGSEGFKLLHYKVMSMSETPLGFLGRHQFLCVDILHTGGDPERLHFFIKSSPCDNASRLEYVEQFGVFRKEIAVYTQVLPILEKIFGSVAPIFYYRDDHNTLLVFENLKSQGFRMAAKRDGLLDYEHLKCALHTLAAMHGASIVLEKRCSKTITELFGEAVVENSYPNNVKASHKRIQNFNNANRVLCEMIKLLPKYRNHIDEIIMKFPQKMLAIFKLCRPSSKYQNVFSHGDLWANNIMFRYGNLLNTIPNECLLVDFQLARYAPIPLDVITILTITTSRDFRQRFLYNLLEDYYNFLQEFLQYEHLNIEHFIKRQTFFDAIEEFRVAGLIESCLFSHLIILPTSLTAELTQSTDGFNDFFESRRTEICLKAFETDAVYRERLTDMIEDFVDNFVLT